MTTTDTDALTERIARALYVEACEEVDGGLTWETEESVAEEIEGWERFAAAVLPIVAVEVRKAKAEAWEQGHSWGWADYEDHAGALTLELDAMPSRAEALTMRNPYLARRDEEKR